MSEVSVFDQRLAEIDRRLGAIQTGLEPAPAASDTGPSATGAPMHPDVEPAAEPLPPPTPLRPAPVSASDDAPSGPLLSQLDDLRRAHEQLLELHRELLSQYAVVLERRAGEAVSAALTAGPFADADALRGFERALGSLPGVTGVAVREYLGPDRVALEVRLAAR